MAARIIANLLVVGGTIVFRAVAQAYQKALVNASKSGVAHEVAQKTARSGTRQITLQEAQMILGVNPHAPLEEVLKRYQNLFDRNQENGSFYIQSKIYRARERIEEELVDTGKAPPAGSNSSSDSPPPPP